MPLLARPVLSSAEAAERPRQIKINPSCLERERVYLASRASSYQTRGEHSDSVQKWAGGRRGEEQRAPGRHMQALPSAPSSLPRAHNAGTRLCFSPACSRRWTSRKETAAYALLQSCRPVCTSWCWTESQRLASHSHLCHEAHVSKEQSSALLSGPALLSSCREQTHCSVHAVQRLSNRVHLKVL